MNRGALGGLVVVACVSVPAPTPVVNPAPPPPPPSVSIPAGCEADLSGVYQHERDARFRYEVSDDGGALAVQVKFEAADAGRAPRRLGRDGGLAWLIGVDAGTGDAPQGLTRAHLSLARTPDGFVGHVEVDGGCPLPVVVLECTSDSLSLESAIGRFNDCSQDAGLRRERLVRLGVDAGDDAGSAN